MKKDFKAMSRSELRQYVMANYDDTEAFHELVDRFNASPTVKHFSAEDADRFPEIYEQLQSERKQQESS
jgi:hypothetical protein